MKPNSDPTIFFPLAWAKSCPSLFEWLEANALHMEESLNCMGWNVWMPLPDSAEKREAA